MYLYCPPHPPDPCWLPLLSWASSLLTPLGRLSTGHTDLRLTLQGRQVPLTQPPTHDEEVLTRRQLEKCKKIYLYVFVRSHFSSPVELTIPRNRVQCSHLLRFFFAWSKPTFVSRNPQKLFFVHSSDFLIIKINPLTFNV